MKPTALKLRNFFLSGRFSLHVSSPSLKLCRYLYLHPEHTWSYLLLQTPSEKNFLLELGYLALWVLFCLDWRKDRSIKNIIFSHPLFSTRFIELQLLSQHIQNKVVTFRPHIISVFFVPGMAKEKGNRKDTAYRTSPIIPYKLYSRSNATLTSVTLNI